MLDVRRMRVLREVARHGSFSAAADALGYTQPAVSRQIATLEAETGMVLVHRRPDGAHLTDAGEVLVRHTEAILAHLDEAEAELRDVAGLRAGRVRLATFGSAAPTVVPLAVARFRGEHPAVELGVEMVEGDEALARLRSGELDIALSHDPDEFVADGIERVHLFDDPMYVALPAQHRLVEQEQVRLTDLAADPWMLATTTTCPDARMFIRACHDAGFEPDIAFENDDYQAILGFVAAGVGVALIPDLVARGARTDVVVRSLGDAAPVRRIAAALARGYRPPATQAMLEALVSVCDSWIAEGSALSPV